MSDSCNSRISHYVKNPPADQIYTEAGTSWAFAGELGVGLSVFVAGVLLAGVVKVIFEAAEMLSMVVVIVNVCADKTIIFENCRIWVFLPFIHIACYQLKKKKVAMMRVKQERFAVY